MKRTIAALPVGLLAATLLVGCSASASANCTPTIPAGSVSDALKVTGDAKDGFSIDSEVPVKATELERTVMKEGKGDLLEEGKQYDVSLTLFNGVDGTQISTEEARVALDPNAFAPWVVDTLTCATVGDRVISAGPASEIVGPGNGANYGIEDTDALVVMFDVHDAVDILERAEGKAEELPKGFPEVELAENGAPTITIPKDGKPSGELDIAPTIVGDGEVVKEGDDVTVQYTGVIWSTGEVFDSSWEKGSPITFNTGGVIPGFSEALVGQTVGSQLVSIVPPAEGYGAEGLKGMGYKEDDTMVFVLDILSTKSPAQ